MNNKLFSRLKDLVQKGKPRPAGGFAGRGGHAAHPAVGAVHPFREDRRSKRRPGG